jgi:septation ring formation regulator EzrA
MLNDDLERDLDKIDETLNWCEERLAKEAEANAALHTSVRVLYSPLHAKVLAARHTLQEMRDKLK